MDNIIKKSLELKKLKTITLQNKLKRVSKEIEKVHMVGNYDKLDDLNLLKNQIEVELESR
ncbi:hypothetical protein LMHOCYYV_CDS0004 [Staphylococcus phage PG-2021_4]